MKVTKCSALGGTAFVFSLCVFWYPISTTTLCRSYISLLFYPSCFHSVCSLSLMLSLFSARSYLQAFIQRVEGFQLLMVLPFLNRTPDSKHYSDPQGTPLPLAVSTD